MTELPLPAAARPRRRDRARAIVARLGPARVAALGYLAYMLAGAALLATPWAGASETRLIDHVFLAVSAVSTTGLASIDPGSTYSGFGEAVILALIQAGGLGFMTVNSAVWLALTPGPASPVQARIARSVFALPPDQPVRLFLGRVVIYTLVVETAGALVLWRLFAAAGVDRPLWCGVFHSVSAFCTAGISLFPTSFEAFAGNHAVLATVSVLAILGAIGFLVAHEAWDLLRRRRVGFTVSSRLILWVSALMIGGGSVALAALEPQLAVMAWPDRLANAFFQAMTASTTVGFNSVPVGGYAHAAVMLTYVLMLVGASPSGTGGGLKSTTVALHWAFLWSVLRGRPHVAIAGVRVPEVKVRQAIAAGFIAGTVLAGAMLVLTVLEPDQPFDRLLFEAISALATAGLSLGITGSLSDGGKAVIIALMYIGRIGILAFGLSLVARERKRAAAAVQEDVVL